MKLPKGMWPRVVEAAPEGSVERILVRSVRALPPEYVEAWTPGDGRDHAKTSSKRAVTLIQQEHLTAMGALLGRPVDPLLLRRNLIISRLNLAAVHGRRLRLGGLVLELTEPCHPCNLMVRAIGADGYTAMLGHGGWCAKIIEHGEVRQGDAVTLAAEDECAT